MSNPREYTVEFTVDGMATVEAMDEIDAKNKARRLLLDLRDPVSGDLYEVEIDGVDVTHAEVEQR